MEMIFVIIIAIILFARDKSSDYNCRNYSRKHGYDKYASSTGLRYTDSNKLVYDVKDKK